MNKQCADCAAKDEIIKSLADRVAAQSELLSRRSYRPDLEGRSFQPDPYPPYLREDTKGIDMYIEAMRRGRMYG